jgi:hypothetical protein
MQSKKIILELVWWLVTVVFVAAVLYPIVSNFVQPFPFLRDNIICLVLLITYSRYIFLLEHTLIARQFWIKMGLVMATFPLMFYLMDAHYLFREFLDNKAPDGFISLMRPGLNLADQYALVKYISNEFVFCVIGSMVAAVAMFVRMIVSIWRVRNRVSKV